MELYSRKKVFFFLIYPLCLSSDPNSTKTGYNRTLSKRFYFSFFLFKFNFFFIGNIVSKTYLLQNKKVKKTRKLLIFVFAYFIVCFISYKCFSIYSIKVDGLFSRNAMKILTVLVVRYIHWVLFLVKNWQCIWWKKSHWPMTSFHLFMGFRFLNS